MMKVPKGNKNQNVLFRGLDVRAVEGAENQYEISFSSEEPYERWFGPEILEHSAEAVNLSRMGDVGTLLFAHGRDPVVGRMPVGKVVRAWLDEESRQCRAVVEFDPDDEVAQRIRGKMEKGMLTGVSVGYEVNNWVSLREGQVSTNGRFTGPAEIAVRWTPIEISIEPTPADATVGFGKGIEFEEEERMPKNDNRTVPTVSQLEQPVAPLAGVETSQRVIEEERARSAEITALCSRYNMAAEEYIRSGAGLDRVRADILDKLDKEYPAVRTGGGISVVTDEGDKFQRAAIDGTLMRGGLRRDGIADGAREYQSMSLRAMAEECLERSGVTGVRRMTGDEVFRRAMSPTSQFVGILSGVVNTAMATGYQAAPSTYQLWTGVGTSTDFRPTEVYQISEAGDLQRIPEGGEIPYGEMSADKMAVRQLYTYGREFGLTREAFINDNIDLLVKMPQAYVRAARRGINRGVYNILKTNPAMRDGNLLFSAAHKNLGTAAPLGTESLAESMAMMRRQTNLGGNERLNLSPKFLLVPALLEVPARQLLVSASDPSAAHSGVANAFQGLLTPIVDAELDVDSGASPYYMAASPMDCDTIEVSYLNGQDMPTLEVREDTERLGLRMRIYIDYGVTLVDHRGLTKNPGKIK